MFWMFVLPAQITLASLLVVVVLATLLAPAYRMSRATVFVVMLLLACLLFIPSCMLVNSVVDPYRFGVFNYPDLSEVRDPHILDFMPPTAVAIDIDYSSAVFAARYKITQDKLKSWIDEQWTMHGRDSIVTREQADEDGGDKEIYTRAFATLGWRLPSDVMHFGSPRSGRCAGWEIWYSPSEGMVYEYANFW